MIVGLVPARAGSTRIRDKNVRPLAGHPAIAYTISSALDSGVFGAVIVSTDSERYAEIARHYGAEVPFMRPPEIAGETSPDIEWVEHALVTLRAVGCDVTHFSILRPTSPFRTAETIRRAWKTFQEQPGADSLRAVEKCQQHPGKMWIVDGPRMKPLLPQPAGTPWHSQQYQALPAVYVQNASLEIARMGVVFEGRTIAGTEIVPFLTEGHEGLDINRPRDWEYVESLVRTGTAQLPPVRALPYQESR